MKHVFQFACEMALRRIISCKEVYEQTMIHRARNVMKLTGRCWNAGRLRAKHRCSGKVEIGRLVVLTRHNSKLAPSKLCSLFLAGGQSEPVDNVATNF